MVGYTGKDVVVEIYIDDTTPGIEPAAGWSLATTTTVLIATSAGFTINRDVREYHGLGNQEPQELKDDKITYEFKLDEIYTNTDFVDSAGANGIDLLELIGASKRFAMQAELTNEVSAAVERTLTMTYCAVSATSVEASDGGDVTGSMSGKMKTLVVT